MRFVLAIIVVKNADTDRLKFRCSVSSVFRGTPAGDPASMAVSDVLIWQANGLDRVFVWSGGEDVFFELEKADIVVHSRSIIGVVVVFWMDEDVFRVKRELVAGVVLPLVVFTEFTSNRLNTC